MFMNPSAPATRAIHGLVLTIAALAATSSAAFAQAALVSDVHTVATSGSPVAVEHSFTITSPGAYTVTLSDLGAAHTPSAPLASVEMAVTQGNAIVGAPQILTSTGSITLNVTASATYILHVIGTPGTTLGSGPIEEDVAPSGGGTKLYSFIDAIQNPPQQQSTSVATVDNTFTAPVTGTYTVTLADLQFPASLQAVLLLLADSTSGQGTTLTAAGSAQLALNAGDSCSIFAIGEEATTAAGGLFSVSLTPPAGTASFYSANIVPIGGVTWLQPNATTKGVLDLGAGSTTITLNDLQFPTALNAAGVAVINGSGQSVTGTTYPTISSSSTTHTASQSFTATAGSYEVFGYATPTTGSTVGSYAVVLTQSTTSVFDDAVAVGTGTLIQPYSFDANVMTAGAYNATLTDFQFPSPLTTVQFAAEQNGALLATPAMAAGSFTVSAAQGQVTFLAFAQATGSGGIFGLDLSSGSGATAAFDVTQGVGAGFKMIPFTVSSAQTLGVTAADVQFPSALSTLEAAVTTGTTVEGKIVAGGGSAGSTTPITGSFSFSASPGTTYFVNVLAQPASPAKAGTYALVVDPAPVVTLTPSVTSVVSGGTVTLTWSTQNATSCTASGGSGWSGSESPSGGSVTTSALTANTTFSLNCTGGGGSASASAAVTVTAASSGGGKSGGGGSLDLASILALAALAALRAARPRRWLTRECGRTG